MSDLRPCAHCGAPAIPAIGKYSDGRAWDYIGCCKCSSIADPMDWNTRAADTQAEKLLGLLLRLKYKLSDRCPMDKDERAVEVLNITNALATHDAGRK